MKEFIIPTNPGLEKLPEDNRDYQYGGIFGAEKYPRKFRREFDIDIPYQRRVPSCVSCAFTFVNQWKSKQEGNKVNLSWRKVHAETGEYKKGRHFRTVAKYLQVAGQPRDYYCVDDPTLPEKEFMDVLISIYGEQNALRHKIGAYSFVSSNLDELLPAIIKEPIVIALGGNNRDWMQRNKIIRQNSSIEWYHAIVAIGYDLDAGYLEVMNWWGDKRRKIDINYPLTGLLSFRDLPDNNSTMLKIIKDGKEQYALGVDGKIRLIYNAETLHELHRAGIVDENKVQDDDSSKYKRGADIILVSGE